MKKNIFLLTLILILITACKTDVYSAGQHTGKLGQHSKAVYTAIKKKLKISDSDIKNAKEKGINAFDLAKERGVQESELRKFIIDDAEKSLGDACSKGLMPRFVENRIKNKVRFSIDNWDGYF